jgi:sugar/nucleoside kinase (ribokinase family)
MGVHMKAYDFKTFAQINLDLIFNGMTRLPEPGEEVFADNFSMQLGGGPAVISVVLNGLGMKTDLGTFLSNDDASKICEIFLKRLNFSSYTNFFQGGSDPVVVTSVFSWRHDRSFLTHNNEVRENQLSSETVYQYLRDSKVVFAPIGHPEVTKRLHKEGTIIVSDTGWEDDLNINNFKSFLPDVDVFTPNDKEAMKMTNTESVEEALKVLACYTKLPVVTLGKGGCAWLSNGEVHRSDAVPFENSIDTTGAGDNFLTGVVYGILTTSNVEEWMRLGNIFAGYSTTGVGCYEKMMTKAVLTRCKAGEYEHSDKKHEAV